DAYRLIPANGMTVALHFATGMLLFAGFAIAAWSR
ncbi:MAG: hypothetical protein QOD06_508, partial [Candidatus Binatota bacterium]|nr:hypothetical protein [Candidatus Binatota bacterium]